MTITLKKDDFTPLAWGELLARLNIKIHSHDITDKDLIAIEIDVKGCVFDVEGVDDKFTTMETINNKGE